jgi:hypothetical protein
MSSDETYFFLYLDDSLLAGFRSPKPPKEGGMNLRTLTISGLI